MKEEKSSDGILNLVEVCGKRPSVNPREERGTDVIDHPGCQNTDPSSRSRSRRS